MSEHRLSGSTARPVGTVVLVAAVCAATALAVLPTPALLRTFVVFPVLVLVAGYHGTTLVLGHRRRFGESTDDNTDSTDNSESTESTESTDVGGLLRVALPVLLGMLALMAVVLLLGTSRIPIATTNVAVGTGAAALVLLWLARRADPPPAGPATGSPLRSVGGLVRRAALPVVAVLVLSAAVAGAVALRPVPVERYTQLALDEPAAVAGRQLSAPIGSAVTLRWTLRGYGSTLPDTAPVVDVVIGELPAAGVRAQVGPVEPGTARGVEAERHGAVTFTAPATAGHHHVRITVDAGTALLLAVGLEVTP